MAKRLYFLIVLTLTSFLAYSQAGFGVYQFLELPASSRITALGYTNVSIHDNDINLAFCNPANLSEETHNTLGLSMCNYLDDIKFGTAIYGRTIKKKNYVAVGVQYVDYGTFQGTTETDVSTGTFTGKDMALSLMYARPLTDKITIGATLKPINSVLEQYTSFGVAVDAGINYNNPKLLLSAGLVVRNLGTQFDTYYSDGSDKNYEPISPNILLGITKKLEHAPLRVSLTMHNLQRWRLNYESTNQSTTSSTDTKSVGTIDMFFRHTIWAVEFTPTKNFYLTGSYNHRRHQELRMDGVKSMSGFSFGGGLKIYKFHAGFGWSQYTVGNNIYHFSISTALNEFKL